MAVMVYQRYTTAVRRGYRDRVDATLERERAAAFREWLASLAIDPSVRAELVEQARALEHGFELAVRAPR
jgi:hypothetical protein